MNFTKGQNPLDTLNIGKNSSYNIRKILQKKIGYLNLKIAKLFLAHTSLIIKETLLDKRTKKAKNLKKDIIKIKHIIIDIDRRIEKYKEELKKI